MIIDRREYKLIDRFETSRAVRDVYLISDTKVGVHYKYNPEDSKYNNILVFVFDKYFYDTRKEILRKTNFEGSKNGSSFIRTNTKYRRCNIAVYIVELSNPGVVLTKGTSFKDGDQTNLTYNNIIWTSDVLANAVYIDLDILTETSKFLSLKMAKNRNGYSKFYHLVDNDFVIISLVNSLTRVIVQVKIDYDDYEKVKELTLVPRLSNTADAYYIGISSHACNKLHRFLMDTPTGKHTDHINRDTRDNRRSNLRNVTPLQNSQNRGISKANSSGITGVSFNVSNNGWESIIHISGKKYSKFFSSKKHGNDKAFELAVQYRKSLEKEYDFNVVEKK